MTTNKTHAALRKEWPLIDRGDGRVEIQCPHGVGHPSKLLSHDWDDGWMRVHGCCGEGCCATVPFAMAEQSHLSVPKKKRIYG